MQLEGELTVGGRLLVERLNTLRTGAFKLFKFTFPGSKQFKSTFIMCFLNIYNKFTNYEYICELKVSGNTHQRP